VKALAGAGLLAIRRFRDYGAARAWLQQSMTLGRALGDTAGVAYALHLLMWMETNRGKSRSSIDESVALFRQVGDRCGLATSLCTLGMAIIIEDPGAATEVLAESLALSRELGDTWGLARALHYSGEVARFHGDDEGARALYEESLSLYRELEHRSSAAIVLHNIGCIAQRQGNLRQALACIAQALAEHVDYGDEQNVAYCLASIAGTAALLEQPKQAARLFGAADRLFERHGTSIWPVDKVDFERNRDIARTQLGGSAFAAAFAAGRELTIEHAIAEATTVRESPASSTGELTQHGGETDSEAGLTPRELEILRMMAHRATDREIADRLSISPRTVMHHVSHVLAKLGVGNRRDAATWAVEHEIA
jgi:DNA-binding CsgD family transcriptional regulator/tetratricopeptide (TPR) repeat protein